jgi:predicted metal-dependent HD superfamily phosphohydrolase
LLGHLTSARTHIRDHGAVALAIWLHDAIYDPQATDNESKSASLADEIGERLNLSSDRRRAVEAMILATVGHAPPSGSDDDLLHFLDFDLSIFGASPATYDAYTIAIREEYRHVPDDAFRAGRRAVLTRFLTRETLYFTAFGRSHWEALARGNLVREIASLS